jgi:hypothetical protein
MPTPKKRKAVTDKERLLARAIHNAQFFLRMSPKQQRQSAVHYVAAIACDLEGVSAFRATRRTAR